MKIEEAIDELQKDIALYESDITSAGDGTHDGDLIQALYMAINALEKQIPKKPIIIGNDYDSHLYCPNCKNPIINVWNKAEYTPNYCHCCGQKLDWNDEKRQTMKRAIDLEKVVHCRD